MSSGPALVLFALIIFAAGSQPAAGMPWATTAGAWCLLAGLVLMLVNRWRRQPGGKRKHRSFHLTR